MKNIQLIKKTAIGIFSALFLFPLCLSVSADALELVPVGQAVGITLDMDGVSVVNTAEVKGYDGKSYTPAEDAGIKTGDTVTEINGEKINSASRLAETVNENGENQLTVKVKRGDDEKIVTVKAILSADDGHYRIGVWAKDAASGIGTVTYYNPESKEFGALGHQISEPPSEDALPISGGSILKSAVVSIERGEKGVPGELMGVFSEDKEKIGTVTENTVVGIKGILDGETNLGCDKTPIPVAERDEVYEGAAEIRSNIEGEKIETFSVEIQKINGDKEDTRGMVVKVTDPRLLEKTGGIVRGQSGSPIIQDGKLVGAVTHVFVNDPTRGYGIFMENMLK